MSVRPNVLRVKRKRGQDPLQALVFEDSPASKRSKQNTPVNSRPGTPVSGGSSYYLLADTGTSELTDDAAVSVLAEDVGGLKKRKFYLSRGLAEDAVVPSELSDMVQKFLDVNDSELPNHKRKTRARRDGEVAVPIEPMSEYVYDTYHLSEPLTTANHPQSQIGYVRFFDEDNDLYQSDEDNELTHRVYSDDEDSNAESFYQNDYPNDEDAEGEILENLDQAEELGDTDDLFDQYLESQDGPVNFLEDSDSEEYERQNFFPGEEEDDLAIHRDKIFGRLQRMIDE